MSDTQLSIDFNPPPRAKRVRTARRLGAEAGERGTAGGRLYVAGGAA